MMMFTANMNVNPSIVPVLDLVKSFRNEKLSCVFLREERYLKPDESDLDFWCSFNQKEKVVEVILNQGWFLVGGRACKNKKGESFVLRFEKKGVNPVFELWIGDLRADALFYCTSEEILKNSISKGDLLVLSDEFLLNILVLRPILKRRNLIKYLERVSHLNISQQQIDIWIEICNKKFGSKVSDLCKHAFNLDPGYLNIFSLFLILIKQYSITGFVKLILDRLMLRFTMMFYQPPLVNFIGTDGSGKSTTAEALHEFLKEQKVNEEYVYAGRSKNNSALVKFARNIVFKLGLAKKISEDEWKTHAISGNKSGIKQGGVIIRILALLIYFVEYHFRYFKIRLFSRLDKKIQILDRGAWDIATINYLGNFPVRLAKYCPLSDITFYCYAKPSIIHERKLERSFSEIIRHQAIYKYLGKCSKNFFIYLDTSNKMSTINQIVVQYFYIVLAIRSGKLDKKTASLIFNMPLSIWEKQSY